jgi:hypothetical protein
MVSVYPDGVKLNEDYLAEMLVTTDQFMYEIMTTNAKLMNSFKSAIEEVALDCEIVKKFGDSSHNCRVCSPTNEPLYTTGEATAAINQDIKLGTRCVYNPPKKVKADEVIIDGKTLYKVAANNVKGFDLYEKVGDKYVKV